MGKLCIAAAALVALAACESTPSRPTQYRNIGWAKVGAQQAEAECRAEINRPGGTPNMYLCMRAKGWTE